MIAKPHSQRTLWYGNLMMQIEYHLVHFKRIMKNIANDIMLCPLTCNIFEILKKHNTFKWCKDIYLFSTFIYTLEMSVLLCAVTYINSFQRCIFRFIVWPTVNDKFWKTLYTPKILQCTAWSQILFCKCCVIKKTIHTHICVCIYIDNVYYQI